MLKALSASGTTGSGEVTKDKRRRVKPSGELGEKVVEGRSAAVDGLKEVEERARLAVLHGEEDTSKMVARLVKGIWLGYYKEEMDAIKADTYAEEEDEEEAEAVGVVDGLDGVSHQTVLDNQGDDVVLPEGGSEKALREIGLRIKDLESGLARERENSKALLSLLKRKMPRYKGLKELEEVIECTEELQSRVNTLAMKDNELRVARENLSASEATAEHLQIALPAKDMEFWEMQRRCNDLNERAVRLKAEPSDILDLARINDPNKLKMTKTCITFALSFVW
ncbi:hypothetical protein GIB67_018589 [Kingdonia uniflora]|uniref:Uncharacterized protein n=1 Tax=Kingdonia uniflora TaxID=39325 RepID=A0A7J7L8I9_9MAGN|nr:hypothetical protein GIB67_018589 [Kingdonia uniflora]